MAVSERFNGTNLINAGQLSPYWGEHTARYDFAMHYVESRTVLDVACGTGYGLGVLKNKARYVTGMDINLGAARDARRQCGENVSVLLGDCLTLPFANASFDVVTSFETLEHLHDRRKFLFELRRVLNEDGTLILSTPNANYTKPVNGKPQNPFHIFEYSPDELKKEMEPCFAVSKILGQTLDSSIKIPPFFDAQQRLPKGLGTQIRLLAWKIMNKMPVSIREGIYHAVWNKPFYPTESDYVFSSGSIEHAPVLVAICYPRSN